MKSFLKKIKTILIFSYVKIYLKFFETILMRKDKFNLSYYIWKDTRPVDTFLKNVRTDDTTVITVIKEILERDKEIEDSSFLFDVGAYIGIISLAFNKFSKKNCIIHSFEPFKKNFERLKKNIDLNNLNNVFLNNFALGNKDEIVKLQNFLDPGMASIVKEDRNKEITSLHTVNSTTLESYISKKNIPKINFIKIDTEGYDYKVLEGCKNLLKNNKIDYLLVEYIHQSKDSKKVLEILQDNEYKVFYLIKNMGKLTNDLMKINNMSDVLNLFAISKTKNLEIVSNIKL